MLGGDRLEIRILTSVPRILVENRPVDVGSPKARLVLAVLAESAGRPVPTPTLIDRVWGEVPPDSARPSLHVYVSRIRKGLKNAGAPTDIKHRSRTYTLEIDPDAVDWHYAHNLSERARKLTRRGEHTAALALLEEALELWDGDPLAEFSGAWADSLRRRMGQGRHGLLGQWAEVGFVLGRHEEILERLGHHPHGETLTVLHMKALAMCGRHTEAIGCYTELREHTVAELGAEPSPRTRALFQRILAEADGDESRWAEPVPLAEPRREVVDTLQPDVPDFLGREEELEALLASVRDSEGRTVVQLIHGLGGVGKTILAAHAAHHLRDRFDVRLQTDLTGVSSDQILFRLLQMLGAPGNGIPAESEARVALWRRQVAGRRVLLLLDNADHHDQVIPAVPGTAGSVVIVTSRRSLSGLHGARRLLLRSLDEEDAARMFAAFTGRDVADEGMNRVVSLTGRLPIALRSASAQLRLRFTWSLEQLADHLERQRWNSGHGADWEALAVFAGTFEELGSWARQTLLCMSLHPTTVISDQAAAASLGIWEETQRALEELLDVHFLEEVSPGRYRMHDLVRQFARQRRARSMSEGQRREVERRIFDYYLATVDNADQVARPGRRRTKRPITRSAATVTFRLPREARDWFADNFPSVERAIEYALERGFPEYVARMPLAMAGLLESNGPWDRAEALFQDALRAWRELDDPLGLADCLYELALVRLNLMDKDGSERCLRKAIEVWRGSGSENEIPHALDRLAMIRASRGDHAGAVVEYKIALGEFCRLRDQRGIAKVYSHMAMSYLDRGERSLADISYTTARALYQALGDSQFEATVTINLIELRFSEGRHRHVRRMAQRCLRLFQEHGDVSGVARARQVLGLLENYLGRYGQALESFQAARRAFWVTRDERALTLCAAGMGSALLGLGRVVEAQRTLEGELELVRSRRSPEAEPPLLRVLGDIRVAQKRHTSARWNYLGALRAAEECSSAYDEGLAYDRLGDLSSTEGDMEQALECWLRASMLLASEPSPQQAEVLLKIRIAADADLSRPG